MATRATASPFTDEDLVDVDGVLRRVVRARVADADTADDVVQETLARLLDARWRLDRAALVSYAVVTARNLVKSRERADDRDGRHRHRLIDRTGEESPDEHALRREEHEAMAVALVRMAEEERYLLLGHEVEGRSVAKLAADRGESAGGVAARLHRARARLRVDYLLAFRRVDLPTTRCRPVLLSLASADRRQQRALGADRHLLDCEACGALSDPLITRRRGLTGIAPVAGLVELLRGAGARAREHAVASAAVGTVVAGGAALAVVLAMRTPSPPMPATQPRAPASSATPAAAEPMVGYVRSGSTTLWPAGPGVRLAKYAGRPVTAYNVAVQSVPADEGFWVGRARGSRLFVHLLAVGESPVRVRPGMRVSFRGTVVADSAGFARRVGVGVGEGAEKLRDQGAHIAVRAAALHVVR